MDSSYDYKKYAILYVDDEEMSLKYFRLAFGEQFRILNAASAQEGFRLLEEHADDIGLLMTDQRMPGEKGVWLLDHARELRPDIIRILVTAYADMESAIDAVNKGAIYKYITKPWDPPQLEQTLKRGLEFFLVQRERDQLLKEKMSVLRNIMVADRILSLGLLAAGLSHHIRNSLVSVKTFLDLAPAMLAEEKASPGGLRNPDFWKEYYLNVQAQIDKINTMLKDLWAASEKPSFEFRDQIALRQVVHESIQRMEGRFRGKNITVLNETPDSLPLISVDRARFDRLFELLFRDEIASLPAGGCVRVQARLLPAQAEADEPEIEIQVTDNGPGLPSEALRLVFDPFVVRADSPMEYGIHLMACYFIVHHHGGSIEARSGEQEGTTFTIRMPVHPDKARVAASEQEFLSRALLHEQLWEKLMGTR